MATDADILPVDVAWRAVGHQTDPAEDFAALYVTAAIAHVVSIIGHIATLVDRYLVEASPEVTLPWGDTGTIVSVVDEHGTPQTGWTRAGDTLTGDWTGEILTISARAVVPADVTVAARQICRQLWLADQAGGGRPSGQEQTPQGFAVPARALTLLGPWRQWAIA